MCNGFTSKPLKVQPLEGHLKPDTEEYAFHKRQLISVWFCEEAGIMSTSMDVVSHMLHSAAQNMHDMRARSMQSVDEV